MGRLFHNVFPFFCLMSAVDGDEVLVRLEDRLFLAKKRFECFGFFTKQAHLLVNGTHFFIFEGR